MTTILNRTFLSLTLCMTILALLFPASGFGQDDKTVSKLLKQADELYNARNFVEATEAYLEVLRKDPENYHATLYSARSYWNIKDYDEAARWYEDLLALDPNRNDTVYFELGIAYKKLSRYGDAKSMFHKFLEKWPFKDKYKRMAEMEIEGAEFAEKEMEKPPLYNYQAIDVNSQAGDAFPSVMQRPNSDPYLIFTSYRDESLGNEAYGGKGETSFSDLWIAKIEEDTVFGYIENLGKKVNTKKNDGSSTFADDGYTMYYTICNKGRRTYGCSIYKSTWDDRKKRWSKPEEAEDLNGEREIIVNTRGKRKKVPAFDSQPMISPDGNTMVFVSDRPGGVGGLDIWYSQRAGDGWSEPRNAGSKINTPFNEISPFISKTGKLYFASKGLVGFGGYDLYEAKGEVGAWENPTNVGHPINSSYDDYGAWWFKNDSSVYFTSDRPGHKGRDDIFFARKKEKPPFNITVHGVVRDSSTHQPIPFAVVTLFEIDEKGDLIPVDTFETDQSAKYIFPLEADKKYKALANAPEYLANEVGFDTKGIYTETDLEKNIDIYLERIIIAFPYVMNNIYYDYDKSDLRPESMAELDRLVRLMEQNPNIKVEIGSHTDTNASDEYNKRLSERRAKSVVRYLIQQGIDPERLSWFGYGESQPLVYPEMSDEDEQLNRRSEFRILTIDYQPEE